VDWRGAAPQSAWAAKQALKTSATGPAGRSAAYLHLCPRHTFGAKPTCDSQFVTTATNPQRHRYAISYQCAGFDGAIPPPLVFDMGPRVLSHLAGNYRSSAWR